MGLVGGFVLGCFGPPEKNEDVKLTMNELTAHFRIMVDMVVGADISYAINEFRLREIVDELVAEGFVRRVCNSRIGPLYELTDDGREAMRIVMRADTRGQDPPDLQ
jgi:hypothetical protein